MSPQRVRKPLGAHRQKLDNSQRAGYHRHWFNDYAGRIAAALEAGYSHVKGLDGKNMTQIVGIRDGGGGMLAYRMEIPLEWYEEDQAAKEANRMEQLAEMNRGIVPGKGDGRYIPVGGDGKPRTRITTGLAKDSG